MSVIWERHPEELSLESCVLYYAVQLITQTAFKHTGKQKSNMHAAIFAHRCLKAPIMQNTLLHGVWT